MFSKPGRLILAVTTLFLGSSHTALAVQYDFLSVSGNNLPGNLASSTFTSDYTSDYITVSHSFSSPLGVGAADNQNLLIPSQFTIIFPGTGVVDGHLAQTVYGYSSVVTFDLTNYTTLKPSTVFGIWNCTDETPQMQPGPPQYTVQLIDAGNNQVDPTTFTLYGIGNQDNQIQVQARHRLVMNPATGDITPGAPLGGTTHMDAAFWHNIPAGTKQIKVFANLDPLNLIGDGVGYYFAEVVVPEPTSFVLLAFGLFSAGIFGSRKTR